MEEYKADYYQVIITVGGTLGYRLREKFSEFALHYSVKVVRGLEGRKVEFAVIVAKEKLDKTLDLIKNICMDPIITILPVSNFRDQVAKKAVRKVTLSEGASVSSLAELYDGVFLDKGSQVVGNAILHEGVRVGQNTFVGTGVIIRTGTTIGDNCHIGTGAIIGDNVQIGNNVNIEENVTIRSDVKIGDNVSIGTAANLESNITIKNKIRIGPLARIFNVGRKRANLESPSDRQVISTVIDDGTFVGSGAIVGGKVGKNVMVGSNAIVHTARIEPGVTIGSGAVVPFEGEVEEGLTVIGSPAKPISDYQKEKKLLKFLEDKYKDQIFDD
ncbi:DapH/DapD/GlmU-related protein [Selenihalanaerobacter shriftii]|uniref:Hexapeptide repeat of succinyl-transferase n=1 Tax=Selenihalanaerobacter shriftii TaxID=142842 RepID=A0A1T4JPS3_9FIRM|nr:DapH/DapD/GlmU-related protein [Selenihalanaerobacter shriftii]SJZ32166.1 Hexapeptide repeat of succinyl-transferase [Selenihalanaerobacter shriftii]